MSGARRGEAGAWRELLVALYPTVRRWASSLTADPDAAEDVTQDALFQVWRHFDSFRGSSRLTTWVYAVTRNAAGQHLRKEQRDRRAIERATASTRACSDPAPRIAARHRLERTLRRLEDLPEDQRLVVELATLGLTSPEVAERIGVRPGTVRARLHRARVTLNGGGTCPR